MHPIQILERYWNHTSFRPLQEDIISSVLAHQDTFVLLPTGGGKSICFQVPALAKEGICIVISPLIALMQDQVRALKSKGIKAIALTAGISYNELDTLLDNCIYGNYKFLYLSPERLQQSLVQERLLQMPINLIAVDEAHCISQWGNDFRPAYKNIALLRELKPHVPCIALTATARQEVVNDIIANLDLVAPKVFKASFKRPNISYTIVHTEDKLFQLQHLLSIHSGSAIVYVRNRKAAIDVSHFLERSGFSSTYYHGGISNKEKQVRLQQWTNNQKLVMVATTAFGMGIDKADVSAVIHFNLPESLESYYQEAGRAGRNGAPAYAIILKQHTDDSHLRNQFLSQLPSIDFIKKVYNKLCNYFQISYGEGENTTHQFDFKSFCAIYKLSPGLAYNVLIALDRNAIITLAQHFNYKTKVRFLLPNAALFKYLESHPSCQLLVKVLLRSYGGIFDFETKIDVNLLIDKTGTTEQNILLQLQQLEKNGIISLQMANTDAEITFLKIREDDITINPIAKIITQQHTLKHKQIEAVLAYVKSTTVCLQKQLLSYFDEKESRNCGNCTVCQSQQKSKKKGSVQPITAQIIMALEAEDLSSRQLLLRIACAEQDLLNGLKHLIEHQKIKVSDHNTYYIA